MIGLAFLAVITLWGFSCYKLAVFLSRKNENLTIKKISVGVLTVFFFLLPIADEIIGGFQFRELCSKKIELIVDEKKARGRVVVAQPIQYKYIGDYFVPISLEYFSYKDRITGEVLVSWIYLRADGGWLSRSLNILSSKKPYTFNGVCTPKKIKTILSDLQLTTSLK